MIFYDRQKQMGYQYTHIGTRSMPVIPLREGFFTISRLAFVSTFGRQRKILDDELEFKGKRYISQSLLEQNGKCFFHWDLPVQED